MNDSIIKAHKYSKNNKDKLLMDSSCGCFYCCEIFNPTEINEWVHDDNVTALCPFCGIDSIIGEYSAFPITKEFLTEMNKYWFL